MSTAAEKDARIQRVNVTNDAIVAELTDGRVISVPLSWSWRLRRATQRERANFRLIGAGYGIHWPDVDEDLSLEGMLRGVPAHKPKASTKRTYAPAQSRRRAQVKTVKPAKRRAARG